MGKAMWPVSLTKSGPKRLKCSVRVLGGVWMCSDLWAVCFLQACSRAYLLQQGMPQVLDLCIHTVLCAVQLLKARRASAIIAHGEDGSK